MTPPRRPLAVLLALALGLGVWGAAFTYTPAAFVDGQVLTANDLNTLLNTNYASIRTALDTKLSRSGDSMTGPLDIKAGPSSDYATLYVHNTATDGYTAFFMNQAINAAPTVGIKNLGTGPALWTFSDKGGAFFEGHTGSLSPAITIKANGTIENAVGSGLPLAYGNVGGTGNVRPNASTANFTVSRPSTGNYYIRIPGVDLCPPSVTAVVSPLTTAARVATYSCLPVGGDNVLYVRTFNLSGALDNTDFSFVIFKPGS